LLADGSRDVVLLANYLDRIFAGAALPALFTVTAAISADIVPEKQLAEVGAKANACFGMGMMLGPWFGAKVMSVTGDPKYTCLGAATISFLMCSYVHVGFEETLPVEKRRDIDLVACNPFAFVALMRKSAVLFKLSILDGINTVCSYTTEPKVLIVQNALGFGPDGIARYLLGEGVGTVMGSTFSGRIKAVLGGWRMTCLAKASEFSGLALWSSARRGWQVGLASFLGILGGQRGVVTNGAIYALANKAGFPNGQVAASLANISNFAKVLGPLLCGQIYSRYGQKALFYFVMMMALAGQGLICNLRADTNEQVFKD